MATDTVTIEKAYFETLLRRAQFHTPEVDFTTPAHLSTVKIPKTDHDSLLTIARHYANLRKNLYRGGIAKETLAILIKDDGVVNEFGQSSVYSTTADTTDGTSSLSPQALPAAQSAGSSTGSREQDYTFGRNAIYTPRNSDLKTRDNNNFQAFSQTNDELTCGHDAPSYGFYDQDISNNDSRPRSTRALYEKVAKRTILLMNLPENPTHSEIVKIVRGGMLLDIYIRSHDRIASISFLEEVHAEEFFRHVKRHDLYIRGKRAVIRWSERHFILPGHVANKIAIGATRNLVIRNRNPKHTEEAIRDDLEHIHNLTVINISFDGQDAFISTNSVHNAMFARTCLMSRATYKSSKIEWGEDECAAPLVRPQQLRQENREPKKNIPTMNRFHLLNIDGTDDGLLEVGDHDTSAPPFQSAMPGSLIAFT